MTDGVPNILKSEVQKAIIQLKPDEISLGYKMTKA